MTKRERLSIYKKFLVIYEKSLVTKKYQSGMCIVYHNLENLPKGAPEYMSMEKFLPELYTQRPKRNWAGGYWWCTHTIQGTKKRIAALKAAIELCKPKS